MCQKKKWPNEEMQWAMTNVKCASKTFETFPIFLAEQAKRKWQKISQEVAIPKGASWNNPKTLAFLGFQNNRTVLKKTGLKIITFALYKFQKVIFL